VKKLLNVLLISSSTLLFAACGSGSSSGSSQSNLCSEQVVDDYNDMVLTCGTMVTDSDAALCKTSAQNFVNNHPGLSCQAQKLSDGSTKTVSTSDAQQVIDKLNAAGL
jgi:hypothetical protein